MNIPWRTLAIASMIGSAYAQSNLPPCPTSGFFHNCFGTRIFNSGNRYDGEFKADKFDGKGIFFFLADNQFKGNKYVGEYKDGFRNGLGTEYASNGSITNQGIWADGGFVRSAPVQQANVPDPEIVRLRAEAEEAKRKQAELESQLRLAQQTTPSQVQTTLDMAKKKCAELGFKLATEGFGKCVLQLSK